MVIEYGQCHCGCGQKTKLATKNDASSSRVKGEPMRYINGHGKIIPLYLLWESVDKSGDCWLWTGYTLPNGYGRFAGKYAHRVSYALTHGEIPEGMNVCHTCDVRNCINPDHLFIGTQKDNIADMHAKGRDNTPPVCGEANPNHKLSAQQVHYIRYELKPQLGEYASVGKVYGVSGRTVSNIVNGRNWR